MSENRGTPRHVIRYDAQGRPSCSVCGWESPATGPQGVQAALEHSGVTVAP